MDLIARPTALNLASNLATTLGVVSQIAPASGSGRKPSPKARKSPSGSGGYDADTLIDDDVEGWQGLQPMPRPAPKRKSRNVYTGTYQRPDGLPLLQGIQWEPHSDGGKEAWHVPPGARHRKDKTYLGYVGKRQLSAWGKLDPDARQKAVESWIAAKREKKGIQ